ncbi:hypothetical protein [Frankia sp. Cj3]|uniref:hypothetical protein n=1 Tax=Frankia sp. Cj3 TaxID=2880976 RepID=UPI001EF65940|nr:hypothetical protein [Frankia sp. Cj3]
MIAYADGRDASEDMTIMLVIPTGATRTEPIAYPSQRWAWARLGALVAGAVATTVAVWPQIQAVAWYAAIAR